MKRIVAILLVVFMMAALLCACSPQNKIIGTWTAKSNILGVVTESTYTFYDDGTGTLDGLVDRQFTYAFADEKLKITVNTLGIETTTTYTYEFKGNQLFLTSDMEDLELTKQ